MRSKINMTWNNMPHLHTTFFFRFFSWMMESQIVFSMTNLHAMKKKIKFFSFQYCRQKCFDVIHHDVHVCIFTIL
jgi:hypothetical protein